MQIEVIRNVIFLPEIRVHGLEKVLVVRVLLVQDDFEVAQGDRHGWQWDFDEVRRHLVVDMINYFGLLRSPAADKSTAASIRTTTTRAGWIVEEIYVREVAQNSIVPLTICGRGAALVIGTGDCGTGEEGRGQRQLRRGWSTIGIMLLGRVFKGKMEVREFSEIFQKLTHILLCLLHSGALKTRRIGCR